MLNCQRRRIIASSQTFRCQIRVKIRRHDETDKERLLRSSENHAQTNTLRRLRHRFVWLPGKISRDEWTSKLPQKRAMIHWTCTKYQKIDCNLWKSIRFQERQSQIDLWSHRDEVECIVHEDTNGRFLLQNILSLEFIVDDLGVLSLDDSWNAFH